MQPQFTEVLTLIQAAQRKVRAIANPGVVQALLKHGKYISDAFGTREARSHNHIRMRTK
ncbi:MULTISPECIES: hypothetical protein [Leptolyngbya]|uniref:hypothetical protein n=1 Tax=Leptolyngbya TaxID=47251 RepID=UPI0003707153|nr:MULTISPECIES: hypothetical protein [Leptolyngbya]MBD2366738.1 hypothetical protein [Leptolyngbya sp. FACHB-161]MBD2373248.1 hypothetical protein [Leptolyngbya sp. FACHB-238]MBD2397648.1 hypothetical protein [Leptolyngbya sp. FACHB-239]MBD2404792.1 hypothetical protein [Leptolyngbya sp. FACHB-402]ULP30368.1 hypothetical protein MCP04_01015 [Leptolyngbya boryana IU 594]